MNGAFALAKGPKISLLTGTDLQDVLLTFNFSASSSHIDLHISIFLLPYHILIYILKFSLFY